MATVEARIVGTRALLLHNGRMGNPTNMYARALAELSKKRDKSDEEILEQYKREFIGGLVMNERGPCLTMDMIVAMVVQGAKARKKGTYCEQSLICEEDSYDLEYNGPRTEEELWNAEDKFGNKKFVDIRNARLQSGASVSRCRPMFKEWACTFSIDVDERGKVTTDDVRLAIEYAGAISGIGDWRERFGKFNLVDFKVRK